METRREDIRSQGEGRRERGKSDMGILALGIAC